MAHNQILSVFSSRHNAFKISRTVKKSFEGVHIVTTIVKEKPSLKKIYARERKSYHLQQGDYVVAIDDCDNCLFNQDYRASGLIHFSSLKDFIIWLDKCFQ